MADNPFTPSFGSVPPLLAGRRELIDAVLGGLDSGPGDPNRVALFVGPRGTGKTALLTAIADEAGSRGWISANVTALDGLLEDIFERAVEAAAEFVPPAGGSRWTGVGLGGLSLTREVLTPTGNWRTRMNRLVDALAQHQVGLLITVDEATAATPGLRELVAVFQHFVRERRAVALLLAGLPRGVSELLQDEKISFLRRAFQHRLDAIPAPEVQETIRQTVELSGRDIDQQALRQATAAADGFAFLIQLIGYHMWRQHPDRPTVSVPDAAAGVDLARADMERMIFATSLAELSEVDRAFLEAMTPDPGASRLADVAQRLGVTPNYANQYRARLIERGLIAPRGRGRVGFDLPMLADYLRSQQS
ncbi:MAG: AAA family ATPase [Propionibacteriaceae bacterium]|nr:AAA family ATPase [Propionibacteriaceae bacterium]